MDFTVTEKVRQTSCKKCVKSGLAAKRPASNPSKLPKRRKIDDDVTVNDAFQELERYIDRIEPCTTADELAQLSGLLTKYKKRAQLISAGIALTKTMWSRIQEDLVRESPDLEQVCLDHIDEYRRELLAKIR